MARDWISIAQRIEAAYPQARGGTNYDEALRSMLVPWANDLIYELGQMQRWSYEYQTFTLTTVQGQSKYHFIDLIPIAPSVQGSSLTIMAIKRIYYIDSAGYPREVERRERFEASRLLGDTTLARANAVPQGAPREFSLNDRDEIEIFPPPDNAGFDTANNYSLIVQCYQVMLPIVETTGNTTALNATLTVPSTDFLVQNGANSSGTGMSVRGAGFLQFAGINDSLTTSWSAYPTATTVTMSSQAQATTTASQVFFNSQPWVITWWPKLMQFGVLREVATYLKDQQSYQLYEQRYQNELNLLRAYEFDRMRGVDMSAAVTAGQATAVDRRIDLPVAFDVRGIV